MNDRTSKPDRRRLLDIATAQHGYFTAAQARECGYSWPLLSHHAASGAFVRVRRGLYRFADLPSSPREEVAAAWLAAGTEEAVISHESALDLFDLSDVIPNSIHVTVPRARRGYRGPAGVTVHTTTRPFRRGEVVVREGMRVTSPARTIVDSAAWGTAPEQVLRAVVQALERGLTTPAALARAADERGGQVARLIEAGLREARSRGG